MDEIPLLLGIVFLFILLLYRFTAPLTRPRPPVMVGALGASVALAAASVIFSWFMARSTNYSLVYGSLASVIILLVWLYLCGNILILGSCGQCDALPPSAGEGAGGRTGNETGIIESPRT